MTNDLNPDENITTPEIDTTESVTPEIDTTESVTPETTILSGDDLAEIKAQLKKQLFDEMKDEQTQKIEQAKFRREEEDAEHSKYVEKMKQSPDPWVDIIGWVRTDEGVKIELEWNDAFVDYLRGNGIKGTDADQVVQKWVTLLLRDMADQMEDRFGGEFE